MHEGSITIRILPEVKEIERLTRLVRQFGELHELPGRTLYAVNLAIDELVTNIVHYAYEGLAPEEIVVQVEVAHHQLTATITDTGHPFDPLDRPAPDLQAPLAERALGGLGIHLVRSLMDRVDYARQEPKNVLTLGKRIR